MAKVLVTGGRGYIGTHLVKKLAELGHKVTVLDDLSTGKLGELPDGVVFWKGDIVDNVLDPQNPPIPGKWWQFWKKEVIKYSLIDFDWVFHLAALPRVPISWQTPEKTARVNIMGALHMLVASKNSGVKRFIYASSSSAYGDQPLLPLVETMRPLPKSPYAVQKLAAEHFVTVYGKNGGIHTTSLRFFNVYGLGQDEENAYSGVLTRFKAHRDKGLPPFIEGDGTQARDFTHVSDVIEACLAAATAPTESGGVYNVSNGRPISLIEAVSHFSKVFIKVPARMGDVAKTEGDPSNAARELGFRCKVPFEEGIKDLTLGRAPLENKDFRSGHEIFTQVE